MVASDRASFVRFAMGALSGVLLALSAGAAPAATISNGSLTGPVGLDAVPPGWTIVSGSPDTNDINNNVGGCCAYIAPPNPSPDGGTWVGLFRNPATAFNELSIESFGQFVFNFTVGATYELSWHVGNFGVPGENPVNRSNAVEVVVSGVSVGSGTVRPLGSAWYAESLSFVAFQGIHLIAFRPLLNERSYLSIDGISIAAAPAVVPLPAPVLLFASGALLLAAASRRSQRRARGR